MSYRAPVCSLLVTMFLIAGCAHKQGVTSINDKKNAAKTNFWAGRISLQIQTEPVQAFFASFELQGQADSGEMTLIGPLGSILGIIRWTPTEAVLEQNGSIKRFTSTDALLAQTTGAAVPFSALFDWLDGKNTPSPGWTADLSQQGNGRITAKRTAPAPPADVRIVLDK